MDAWQGLSSQEAQDRLKQFGYNSLKQKVTRSFARIFFEQFQHPLMYLLLGSGVVIFFAGARFDAYIIAGIVALNTIIGALQEARIAYVVDALQKFKKQQVLIVRDGVQKLIESALLVPGDTVIVQQGEKVPADGKLVQSYHVTVDESLLTGESHPVEKQEGDAVYSGSYLLTGYARVLVEKTGQQSRIGSIHDATQTAEAEMPLQKDVNKLVNFILITIVAICVALLVIGLLTGKPFGQLLAALTALFICVLPQGITVIMTVVLVSGAYRMAQRQVFAKKLQAIEALGRIDVMVLDKTGTLTRNELMVSSVITQTQQLEVTGSGYKSDGQVLLDGQVVSFDTADDAVKQCAIAAILLNHSEIQNGQKLVIQGNRVDAAMGLFAQKLGLDKTTVHQQYQIVYEIPFGSDHKYHACFTQHDGKGIIFGLGAPEAIMQRCNNITGQDKKNLEQLLEQGMRVVAVATGQFDVQTMQGHQFEKLFNNLQLLGFFGLTDSLKDDAAAIVKQLQDAGIRMVMATGDNETTAQAMATKAGIAFNQKNIFARVTPEQKMDLIKTLQQEEQVVAMVGDGVNDAPALSAANLSIAMGHAGADLAKEAADIILLDDSFGSVIYGIEQGRHIFTSFKRVILYFFTTNFSEVAIMLLTIGFGMPLPLLASQILWLNLVTDGFIDFSLAMEPQSLGLLHGPWPKDERTLLTTNLILRIFYQAGVVAAISFYLFYYYAPGNLALARTLVMAAMTICYWFLALNCRSLHASVFKLGLFANRWLATALFVVMTGLFLIIHTKIGNSIFQTVPLSWQQWRLIFAIGISLFVVDELKKLLLR